MTTATRVSVAAARRVLAARALHAPLGALAAQIEGVRAAREVEAVHKTRVASRRIRNALDLFFDALPPTERPRWLRRIRRVTRALGVARDLDVQLLYLDEFAAGPHPPDVRRGLALLSGALAARRRRQQKDVRKAMDRLEADAAWRGLRRWARQHAPPGDAPPAAPAALRAEAARAVHARLADVLAFARYVPRPRCVAPLHAMRIAAKHLRYTVEVYAPLYPRGLDRLLRWGRWLQDTLGALHDCDVWQAELPTLRRRALRATDADRATRTALARAVAAVRADRAARRRALHAELVAWWSAHGDEAARRLFRRAVGPPPPAPPPRPARRVPVPPPFDVGGDPLWAPALSLARACRYEAAHTHHVTYLALRLFDELAPLHGLGPRARTWLGWAGLLHDIGWVRGRAGHHKTAARLIAAAPQLPWPPRIRRIVATIARYHRRALPRLEHTAYGALPAADRRTVAVLAALLRLADGLDYAHQGLVRDVRARISSTRISVLCSGRGPAAADLARGREKSDLARRVFGREVVVRWHEPRAGPTDRS